MQGSVVLRPLSAFALAICISGCNFNTRSTAGQTPVPSNTTIAQANSTSAPGKTLTSGPGAKYVAKTSATLKGVTFSVWANGQPIGTVSWPGKSLDITSGLRGHANQVVIEWDRTAKNGSGTMTIESQSRKTILVANVSPHSPAKGRVSKTFIAAQGTLGQPHK